MRHASRAEAGATTSAALRSIPRLLSCTIRSAGYKRPCTWWKNSRASAEADVFGRSSYPHESRVAVATAPGHTAVTRTPDAAAYARSHMLSTTRAWLVIADAGAPEAGRIPASEAVFTICPERCL